VGGPQKFNRRRPVPFRRWMSHTGGKRAPGSARPTAQPAMSPAGAAPGPACSTPVWTGSTSRPGSAGSGGHDPRLSAARRAL